MKTELLYCPVCNLNKSEFEKHKKNMSDSPYFSVPKWDGYRPIIFKDRISNEWVIECQNCGLHLFLHAIAKQETIKQWNDINRGGIA